MPSSEHLQTQKSLDKRLLNLESWRRNTSIDMKIRAAILLFSKLGKTHVQGWSSSWVTMFWEQPEAWQGIWYLALKTMLCEQSWRNGECLAQESTCGAPALSAVVEGKELWLLYWPQGEWNPACKLLHYLLLKLKFSHLSNGTALKERMVWLNRKWAIYN